MFERFTDNARHVIVLSQEEARKLHHNYIGTEHLLLGLIDVGDGLGVGVLRSLNADPQVVADQVKELVGQGQASTAEGQHIPFTPNAKKTLELSLSEARGLNHDYIGTEHLLLAMLRLGEGPAYEVLTARGVDLDTARAEVTKLLHEHGAR